MLKIGGFFPDNLRGVRTEVRQVLDLGALDDKDLKRVLNAVKRGATPLNGFVATIAQFCAASIGCPRPVQIGRSWTTRWALDVRGIPAATDIPKLNAELVPNLQTRWALCKANNPNVAEYYRKNSWAHEPTPGPQGYNAYCLLGVMSRDDARKLFMPYLYEACPGYKESMQKLYDYIASKPTIEHRREFTA